MQRFEIFSTRWIFGGKHNQFFISQILFLARNLHLEGFLQLKTSISLFFDPWNSFLKLTLWCLAIFGNFREKNTEMHVALCGNFSAQRYRPGKRLKRSDKSSSLHSKKNFFVGVCGFFVSDIISGGLLGHLGPLYLALGANH